MDFLSWYDWITPTNPFASLFFGVIFTVIIGITVWIDTKKLKTTTLAMIVGVFVTIFGVTILNFIGFYN
ncbi:hypothetical protein AABM38_10375 [Heyndrickxia sp. MSNUG]|uniref:hypothetical protein n=1 Tax=Heyndrickxia sp. MSNUG TaxID=3136677 RepID=UPI003C2ED873